MKASGSPVRSRACTSARASICRETRFCTGVESSRADGDEEEQQRRRPAGRRPTRRRRGAAAASRTAASRAAHTAAAAPSAPSERAGEDVVGGDVPELVGDDRLDLVVGQLLEHACRRRRSGGSTPKPET